ncbi:MAG: LOG family protein [Patescibacteria group bacterium]
MIIKTITILGGAEWKEDEAVYKETFTVCKALALSGYKICNGGGPGVMRAATEGAHEGGGKVIGVTMHPKYHHPHFEGRDPDNNFDEEVDCGGDYFDRTKRLLQLGDVHMVFKGGTGTISEFGMSWAVSRIHEGHNKPMLLYGNFWKDIIEAFKTHMYMRPDEFKLYKIATSSEEVLHFVKDLESLESPFPVPQ